MNLQISHILADVIDPLRLRIGIVGRNFFGFSARVKFGFLFLVALSLGVAVGIETHSGFAALIVANGCSLFALPMFGPMFCAPHIELVSFSATAPGAAGAAAAALAGDSLVVKNAQKSAKIISWWADQQTAGFQQLSFPSGHDTTRGLRTRVRASEVDMLLPEGIGVEVQPQETLSALIAGSAVAGDVESGSLLMLYDGLLGSGQRGISWADLSSRIEKLTTIDLALAGAAAGYTGAEALNADIDLLLANRDYALLGGATDVETQTIVVSGPDTANVRIGFPANELDPEPGMNFFPRLARAFNQPIIPVLNSGNKAATSVSFIQDENNINPKVSLYLALLKA